MGYSFSDGLTTKETVVKAFQTAIKNGGTFPSIFHSDKGSQYSSAEFRNILKNKGIWQSMTTEGNCYDNAYAESFFKTIKYELIQFLKGISWEKALFELRKIKTVSYTTKTGIHGISLTRIDKNQEKIFKTAQCLIPKLKHVVN